MADLVLQTPVNNEQVVISINDTVASIDLGFAIDEALFEKVDNNLEIHFDSNGSSIVLEDFYTVYNGENVPDFLVDNSVLSGEDFFAALDSSLMPAAGDENVISNDGLGFNNGNSENLQQGLESFDDTQGGSDYTREGFQGTFSQNNSNFQGFSGDAGDTGDNDFVFDPVPLPSINVTVNLTVTHNDNVNSFSTEGNSPTDSLLEQLGDDILDEANMTWQKVNGYKPTTNVTELDFNGFTLSAQTVQFESDNSYYAIDTENPTFVWRTDESDGADASYGLGIFSDSNNDSAYETGFNNQTDQAEIFVVKLDEGKTADSIEIKLGTFFDDSHAKDPQPEVVLVEFYRDGNLVYSEEVTSTSQTGSATLSFNVTDFDEVRIIPAGDSSITTSHGTDFTLEGITLTENLHTVSGEVEVENFGSALEYEIGTINGIDLDSLSSSGEVVLGGATYDYTKSDDNTSFSLTDKDGNAALDIEVDANGSYTITEKKDLDFDLDLSFDVTNENGDEISSTSVGIDFSSNTVHATDASEFLFGSAGADVFLFGNEDFSSESDTITDLNKGDVLDLSAFKESGYTLSYDESAGTISVTDGTETLDIFLNSSTIADFDMEAMQQDFDTSGIIKI